MGLDLRVAAACRADSIVADAELVRECLRVGTDPQSSRWSLLGQSFGGFCAVQYLSVAPQGQPNLPECFGVLPNAYECLQV